MQTQKKPRIVSAVLVALSVLLLLFGWVGVKGEYGDELKDTMKEAVTELNDEIKNYDESYYSYVGIEKKDLKKLRSFIGVLKDGALSPVEISSVAPSISGLSDVLDAMGGMGMGVDDLQDSITVLWIVAVFTWITMALGVITALVHFVGNRRGVGVLYGICFVLLVLLYIGVGIVMDEETYGAMGITLWPFVALVLLVLSAFTDRTAKAKAPVGAAPVAPAVPGWTCPGCGNTVAATAAFCTKCGTAKPQATYCVACGAELRPGAAFCTKCGAKQNEE